MQNPLEELIATYVREQRKVDKEYSQKKFAAEIDFDPTSVSKYIHTTPSKRFLEVVLEKIVHDTARRKEKLNEILAYFSNESTKGHSASFDQFQPVATAVEFHPFVVAGKAGTSPSGFAPDICSRFFSFCHKRLKIEMIENFDDAFRWVKDEHKPHTMVLNASETIPRSTALYTFQSPAAAPLNVVVSFKRFNAIQREKYRKNFLEKEWGLPFIAVKDEIGYDYIREEFRRSSEDDLLPLKSFSPQVIASKIIELSSSEKPYCFIGDELICLQVARHLNLQSAKNGGEAYGFLFPLATLAISRSDQYALIPTYKFGLFSVLQTDEVIIRFLRNSLHTMFDNDRFYISLQYRNLAVNLTSLIAECISKLPLPVRRDLYDLHNHAHEAFQFSSDAPQFSEALASRVVRQTLRLNTQLIEVDDELNLPWKPILELVRHKLLGPLPAEFRDLRFDQASLRCRVFPPFLSTTQKPGEKQSKITNWGLFGPVLAQIADLVNLEDEKATVPRADSERGLALENDHLDWNPQPAVTNQTFERTDMTVGIFDVPIRAYDQHFFRFPISLQLNALLPGGHRLDQRMREVLQKLFKTRAKVLDTETVGLLRQRNERFELICLRFTAAHYLSTDWGFDHTFVGFDPDGERQLDKFKAIFQLALDDPDGPIPLILADELTCFRLMPRLKAHKPELLFQPKNGPERTRYFYSIGIERGERPGARSWWDIMQDALPVAIVKSRTQIIDAIRKLRKDLKPISVTPCGSEINAKEWLDHVFCLDLARSADRWSDRLLSDVWRSIILDASDEKSTAS